MKIAKKLIEENACEYLLYMWQLEDTLRAYGLDEERVKNEYVSRFPEEEREQETQWLSELIRMMKEEGCQQTGHLQKNKGTLALLVDLHQELLHSAKHPFYSATYYKALPFIVELRTKSGKGIGELETCLNALYGVMILRLQGKEISSETQTALGHISHLLALLSDARKKEKEGTLEL